MSSEDTTSVKAEMVAASQYIQPPTAPFRLYSVSTKAYLYTNEAIGRRVQTLKGTSPSEDQWFSAEMVDGNHSEQAYYRSRSSNQWMSLGYSPSSNVILTYPMLNDDEKLLLEAGTGSRAGQFRIFCPFSKLYAVASFDSPPGVYKLPSGDSDHAWWQFVFRDPVLTDIIYEPNQGIIRESTLLKLNSQSYGPPDTETQYRFNTNASVDHSCLWKLPPGFPREARGSFGVPGVSQGKIIIESQRNLHFEFDTPLVYQKQYQKSFTLVVPSSTETQADATVTKAVIEVPFTAKFRSGEPDSDVLLTAAGVFHGTTTYKYNLETNYATSD